MPDLPSVVGPQGSRVTVVVDEVKPAIDHDRRELEQRLVAVLPDPLEGRMDAVHRQIAGARWG